MRVPEFLPDALWDRSRTYAAGGGHDDEHLPSWKHVQQADPRKDQRQLGIIKTFEFSIALAFLGHVLLFVGSPETVMAGALFFGVTLPLSSVMMPLFCRIFWKGETYSTAYAYSTMVGTLLGAPFNMWFGTFYDITGDYRLTIGVSAAMLIMLTFLIVLEGVLLKRAKSGKSPSQAR